MIQLLTSEKYIKDLTAISDNIAGKYLFAAMLDAQESKYREIVGDKLLDKLKEVAGAPSPENINYRKLIERSQMYLCFTTMVELLDRVTYKITNFGLAKSTDTNLTTATPEEIDAQRNFYQNKADDECAKVQNYILDNRSSFPELSDNDCNRLHANLTSAASCGVWLGGARGRGAARKTRR